MDYDEHTQVIERLDEDYRHDLAVHLYTSFLMHRLNPFFPWRRWTNWPQHADAVPDPRTTATYMDPLAHEKWAPEPDIVGVYTEAKRKRVQKEQTRRKRARRDAAKKAQAAVDASEPHNGQTAESDSDSDSAGSEPDRTIEDAAKDDALEILNRESDSSSDSESEAESEPDTRKSVKYTRLKVKQTPSDARVDLLMEAKALIHQKIRAKLAALQDPRISSKSARAQYQGRQITLDFDTDVTELMAKSVCEKVDGLLAAWTGVLKSSDVSVTAKKRLSTWRDLLHANLSNTAVPARDAAAHTTRAWARCEQLFDQASYEYQYVEEGATPFSVPDYMDKMKDRKTTSSRHKSVAERITAAQERAAADNRSKDAAFRALLAAKNRDILLSWNQGISRINAQGRRRRAAATPTAESSLEECAEYAVQHQGMRLDLSEYYMDI